MTTSSTNHITSTPHESLIDDENYYATYFPDPTIAPDTQVTPIVPQVIPLEGTEQQEIMTVETVPVLENHDILNQTQANPVQLAYEQVGEDTKFVRLTTITTIIHSIFFLIYIGFNGMRMMPQSDNSNDTMTTLLGNIMDFFAKGSIPRGIIGGLGLILAIGYFILPPIGEAAMIFYLGNDEKRGSISLAKGFGKFFPMFEYNGMISFFTLLPFFIIVSRFFMLHLLDNIFVIIILFLRGLIILFAYIFLPFTKFYIVQENLQPLAAMKKSMQLSLENIGTVIRYTFLQYALSIRFIINIVLFLGMPLLILYTANAFDITAPGIIGSIILIVTLGIGLLIAYVNGIIEAFFMTLRYRLFQQLK